ncbi:MAG: hypothetical protein COB16_04910 [Rhodobacteraceae bacterium]|nr:MAG: hypothetical protein COB16_04910 [Paracoccaceae bacterium]
MPFEMILLLATIGLGAVLQVGIGIGFSIVAGPLMFLLIGTETAVPILLLLNVVVSTVATPGAMKRSDQRTVITAVLACVVGIGLGILIYPQLTEAMVLAIAGGLLVFGALSTFLPVTPAGKRAFLPISCLSGLATVWAATPGPLMALGLILADHPVSVVRKLVQPIALIAYSLAFLLHAAVSWDRITDETHLPAFLAVTVFGSLIGRWIGPTLPRAVISSSIRGISLLAGLILLYRALTIS